MLAEVRVHLPGRHEENRGVPGIRRAVFLFEAQPGQGSVRLADGHRAERVHRGLPAQLAQRRLDARAQPRVLFADMPQEQRHAPGILDGHGESDLDQAEQPHVRGFRRHVFALGDQPRQQGVAPLHPRRAERVDGRGFLQRAQRLFGLGLGLRIGMRRGAEQELQRPGIRRAFGEFGHGTARPAHAEDGDSRGQRAFAASVKFSIGFHGMSGWWIRSSCTG